MAVISHESLSAGQDTWQNMPGPLAFGGIALTIHRLRDIFAADTGHALHVG